MSSGMVNYIFKKNLTDYPPPHIDFWYKDIAVPYIVLTVFAVFATVSVLALGALHLYFVIRYVSHPSMQTDLYWIVLLCPIVALCNGVGVCVLRAGAFLYSVGIVYYLLCIFVLITLMTTLYGSRSAMSSKLLEKDITLNPRVLPFTCCCLCLPNIKPTHRNIRFLEWAVFQSPIVRVIIEIMSIAVYSELETKNHVVFNVMNVVSFISMIISSYSSYVLFPAGCKQLKQYRFLVMFRLIDWTQFIYSFQKWVLEGILALDLLPFLIPAECKEGIKEKCLSQTATMQFWSSFLATIEMLFLSALATYLFRPSKTAFFDAYPVNNTFRESCTPLPTTSPVFQTRFACLPALDPTITDEPQPSKGSADPENNVRKNELPPPSTTKETSPKPTPIIITTADKKSSSKLKDAEIASPYQETKTPATQTNVTPALTPLPTTMTTPLTSTVTMTPLPKTTPAAAAPATTTTPSSSNNNIEILQVEPTQEITDKTNIM